MTTNSSGIWWSRRRRAVAVSLVFVAAALLSTVSLLTLHWVAAPKSGLGTVRYGIGFVQLNRPAHNLTLPNLGGQGTIELTKLAGTPIVMNFWKSSCPPCKKETPALAAAARALRGKVTFLGIDSVDQRGAALAFIRRYRVPYPVAFDPKASAASQYSVPALPVTIFLSPSARTVVGENIGALTPSKLRAILHRLYGVT